MTDDRFVVQHGIVPENSIELRVLADAAWQRGVLWGVPRPGHPEGQVIVHVRQVLDNVERYTPAGEALTRLQLRQIALLHDACKRDARPRGPHHGELARRLAERHINDEDVLDVIELHDEAYACWRLLDRHRVSEAHQRAGALLDRIDRCLELYLLFYLCDTMTIGKQRDALDWFETFVT